MPEIDSRALTNVNCYGRRLATAGEVRYAVGTPGAAALRLDELPFVVRVAEAGEAEPHQHDVTITSGSEGLTASPATVEAAVGDVVVWTGTDDTVPPFVVWGQDGATPFASSTLDGGTFFSHVFGTDGSHAWHDANGSGLSGVVRVRPPARDTAAAAESWAREMSGGHAVVLTAEKPDPAELEIVTGQTVFFVAADVAGVTLVGDDQPAASPGEAS